MALAGIVFLQASCKKDGIMPFKGDAAINFMEPSQEYSFLGNPLNEYTQDIDVRIIGDATDRDRHFNVEVIKDSTTAKTNDYKVIGGVVKAGEFTGKLSIVLLNSEALNSAKVKLKVKLINSDDFKPGNVTTNQFTMIWTNMIVVPSWTYFRYYFTTAGSTNAYRIIVETTGLKTLTAAQFRALPAVALETMATKFGDYVKQWNKDHPTDRLKHDSGTLIGKEIDPLYYTHSKFD